MDREQKQAAVSELTDDLKGADAIFAVDYRGISVTEAAELRGNLAAADAAFKVVKNRLAKRAVAEAGTEAVEELLVGPTALTLVHGDAVVAAKAISNFAKEHDVLTYKGGIMDGAPLDSDGFAAIARLPGIDVLHGQLVGLTASPLTGLVTGLGSLISGLAVALGQIAEQGLVSGESPPSRAFERRAERRAAGGERRIPSGARAGCGRNRRQRNRRQRSSRRAAARRSGSFERRAASDERRNHRGGIDVATTTEEWIEELKGISVLELSERIKALEEEFGVSATAVAAAAPAAAGGGGEEAAAEESSTVDVVLTGPGEKKIQVIKAVRAATGLGLKDAKALVDDAPKAVKEGIEREEADKLKAELEEAGGSVELK